MCRYQLTVGDIALAIVFVNVSLVPQIVGNILTTLPKIFCPMIKLVLKS